MVGGKHVIYAGIACFKKKLVRSNLKSRSFHLQSISRGSGGRPFGRKKSFHFFTEKSLFKCATDGSAVGIVPLPQPISTKQEKKSVAIT